MAQSYNPLFARVYNQLWAGFASQVAPRILEYYESTPIGKTDRSLLDLACGTGQLALIFLENGYRVTGLDLSPAMLEHAHQNAGDYRSHGQATFIQRDITSFTLDEQFGLAVSTYDALNHLPGEDALSACIRSTYNALQPGGYFIFDLNTRKGLERWNNIQLEEGEQIFLVNRGIFDPSMSKAWTRITGFVRNDQGFYERFDETVYNSIYDLMRVVEILHENGFQDTHIARGQDLSTPLEEPEEEGRVFFVAHR